MEEAARWISGNHQLTNSANKVAHRESKCWRHDNRPTSSKESEARNGEAEVSVEIKLFRIAVPSLREHSGTTSFALFASHPEDFQCVVNESIYTVRMR